MILGKTQAQWGRWGMVLTIACLAWMYGAALQAQSEQVVEVTIKDSRFMAKQGALRLGFPTVITIRNLDGVRHDFGSTMFEGIPTKVERDGVVVYGKGVGGVLLDPSREAVIRFMMQRPGKHEFRCSIHPNMKGEFLLLSAEAV